MNLILNFGKIENHECRLAAEMIRAEVGGTVISLAAGSYKSCCSCPDFRCFYGPYCAFAEDGIYDIYRQALNSELIFFVISCRYSSPPELFSRFTDRSRGFFGKDKNFRYEYLAKPKRLVLFDNHPEFPPLLETLERNLSEKKFDPRNALVLQSHELGVGSLSIGAPEAQARLKSFLHFPRLDRFYDSDDLQKPLFETSFQGSPLTLCSLKPYDGPVTLQYLPSGGVQSLTEGRLIIATTEGFMAPDEVIYNGVRQPTSDFVRTHEEDLVNSVFPS